MFGRTFAKRGGDKVSFRGARFFVILAAGVLGFGMNYSEPVARYRATTTLKVEFKPEMFSFGGSQENYLSNDFRVASLNTIVETISNTELMRNVIMDRDLLNRAEFVGRQFVPEGDIYVSIDRYARMLASSVTASLREGTHLIDISVSHSNPGLARDLVNWVAEGLIKQEGERIRSNTGLAMAVLSEEADRLKQKLMNADAALNDFRKTLNLTLPPEQQEAFLRNNLSQLQQTVVPVRLKIIKVSDDLSLIEDFGERVTVEQLAGILSVQDLDSVKRSRELIQSHMESRGLLSRAKRLSLEADDEVLAHLETLYQKAILDAPASIELELRRLQAYEQSVGDLIEETNKELLELSQVAVEYDLLKNDVETTKSLRESVRQTIREFDLSSGLKKEVLSVVQESEGARDITPLPYRKGIVGALFGILSGVAIVLLFERFNLLKREESVSI